MVATLTLQNGSFCKRRQQRKAQYKGEIVWKYKKHFFSPRDFYQTFLKSPREYEITTLFHIADQLTPETVSLSSFISFLCTYFWLLLSSILPRCFHIALTSQEHLSRGLLKAYLSVGLDQARWYERARRADDVWVSLCAGGSVCDTSTHAWTTWTR